MIALPVPPQPTTSTLTSRFNNSSCSLCVSMLYRSLTNSHRVFRQFGGIDFHDEVGFGLGSVSLSLVVERASHSIVAFKAHHKAGLVFSARPRSPLCG